MIRIGHGTDVHRFATDPAVPLVLGGIVVPGSVGLAGHSDADVATHALCDAILGAAGLGDLGRRFPEDESTRDVRSLELLAACCSMAHGEGFVVGNADVSIAAQTPRLAEHLDKMASSLSAAVAAPVSVKATTTDGLGAIGRSEGIGATAVVLLVDRASAP